MCRCNAVAGTRAADGPFNSCYPHTCNARSTPAFGISPFPTTLQVPYGDQRRKLIRQLLTFQCCVSHDAKPRDSSNAHRVATSGSVPLGSNVDSLSGLPIPTPLQLRRISHVRTAMTSFRGPRALLSCLLLLAGAVWVKPPGCHGADWEGVTDKGGCGRKWGHRLQGRPALWNDWCHS